MQKYPRGRLTGFLYRLASYLSRCKLAVYASHASFFIILSFFPALVLLLSLLRYAGLDGTGLTGLLEGLLPEALLPAVRQLILSAYRNTSGALISLSAVTALWSASRGVQGLMNGLNRVYSLQESRGWLRTRLVSMGYTVLFLLVLLLTLILQVFGRSLIGRLAGYTGTFALVLAEVLQLRFFLLLFLQTGLFTALFMFLPNRRHGLLASLPGALLSSVGWLSFSNLYSLYVVHASDYASIYGSVYALALSMLWLYFCICILLCGGALNHWLETEPVG